MSDKRRMKAGIVCCSNGMAPERKEEVDNLLIRLEELGISALLSSYIFVENDVFSGTGEERAKALMDFYRDEEIEIIFDISGGDIANEVLPYLDFAVIAKSGKQFWGYSDLTTIVNAIYTKTGNTSVLYQARNLVRACGEERAKDFMATVFEGKKQMYDFDYQFVQGESMEGIVVGGNIRCFLKLAGTEYWPNMSGKILLLEAWRGGTAQMTTFLSQLQQIGVFRQIEGVILGTFTQMEEEKCEPDIVTLVMRYAGTELPILKTQRIGHGADSKAIVIGERISLSR